MQSYRRLTGGLLGVLLPLAVIVTVILFTPKTPAAPPLPFIVGLSGAVWILASLLVRVTQLVGEKWLWADIVAVLALTTYWTAVLAYGQSPGVVSFTVVVTSAAMLADVTDLIWLIAQTTGTKEKT